MAQAHAKDYEPDRPLPRPWKRPAWATNDTAGPARENPWRELQAAGVDHTNTDGLPGLQECLTR